MKTILITIAFLAAMNIYSQPVKDFRTLDSIWDTYKENKNFSYTGSIFLADYYYYKEIQCYMDSIFSKNMSLIRVINAQIHWISLYSIDFIFNPDVFFLYQNENSSELRLVYWDKKIKKIINKKIATNFDFKYLLKSPNYKGFTIDWKRTTRNWLHFLPYGTGLSISVYSPKEIFVKSIEEFWKNNNDTQIIEFFDEVKGKEKTINNIKKMLLEIRDFVQFDDHCRDCYKKQKADSLYFEYQKIRHTIIDVEAVERREKEWIKQREPEKK